MPKNPSKTKLKGDGGNEYPEDVMEKVPHTHKAAWELLTPEEGGEDYDPQEKKAREDSLNRDYRLLLARGLVDGQYVLPLPSGDKKDDDEETSGIHAPLKCHAMYLCPEQVHVRTELIHRHDANPETGISQQVGIVEFYDRDKSGPILVWMDKEGRYWCVDGHHRLAAAKAARHIVSSYIIEGELVSTSREIAAIVFMEEEGWSIMQARKLGESGNLGGGLKIEFVEDLVDAGASRILTPEEARKLAAKDSVDGEFSVYVEESFCTDSSIAVQILSVDSKKGSMRVRQKASRADSVNLNNRLYPGAVLLDAAKRAKLRAKDGRMISEFEHPTLVTDCSGGKCTEKFVSNPERETAVVTDVDDHLDADKFLWIERDIKSTNFGSIVQDSIRNKDPVGISTRFFVRGKQKTIDGKKIIVADYMDIITFDDVKSPAVRGAGQFMPVTDSVMEELTGDARYLGEPFSGVARNTVNPNRDDDPPNSNPENPGDGPRQIEAIEQDNHKMDILQLIGDLAKNYSKPGAHSSNYVGDACAIIHMIKAEADSGQCVDKYKSPLMSAIDKATMSGYRGGTIYTVIGSELGGPGNGWGSQIEVAHGENRMINSGTDPNEHPHGTNAEKGTDKGDIAQDSRVVALFAGMDKKERKAKVKGLLRSALDEHKEFEKEDEEDKEDIKKKVKDAAMEFNGAPETFNYVKAVDNYISVLHRGRAKERLAGRGHVSGRTTTDTGGPIDQKNHGATGGDANAPYRVEVIDESPRFMPFVEKMLGMADDQCRMMKGDSSGLFVNPDDADVQKLRKFNRKLLVPVLDDFAKKQQSSGSLESFRAAIDSVDGAEADFFQRTESIRAAMDSRSGMAAIDATTTATIFNQPYILPLFLIQAYQDLTCFQFIGALGPREFDQKTGGFLNMGQGVGSNLRLPTYSYTDAGGWGYQDARVDFGGLVPEGQGIAPGNTNVYWLNYSLQRRKLASIITWEALKNIGNGPANMPLVSLELYMMAAKESRVIDRYGYNEMIQATYRFGAVGVTAEAYNTGNNLLPNNSVYSGTGGCKVNLNPAKLADAAVTSSDLSVTYASSAPAGQILITGVCRLLSGGLGTGNPYYGFKVAGATIGPGPICRPDVVSEASPNGSPVTVTTNPVAVTVPSNMVQGEVSAAGCIVSYPGTTATFAIDYENGCIVFATGSVTGGGGVMTTSFTMGSYSYATNWDDVILDKAISLALGLWGGGSAYPTYEAYLSTFMTQIDATSAKMGTVSNFVKPDIALMNLIGSSYITPAQLFAPLFSPPQTKLWPTPTALAERNGITFHQHNTPWNAMSSLCLLSRKGVTRYANDTPFMIQGPVTVQDANGNPTGELAFYGQEFSVMATPFPTDINGNILNCSNRAVLMRFQNQGIGIF